MHHVYTYTYEKIILRGLWIYFIWEVIFCVWYCSYTCKMCKILFSNTAKFNRHRYWRETIFFWNIFSVNFQIRSHFKMHPAYKSWSCEAASFWNFSFKNKQADIESNISSYLWISIFTKSRKTCDMERNHILWNICSDFQGISTEKALGNTFCLQI